jgi:predicted TIM-barrel fold metal-dependent hydrolase
MTTEDEYQREYMIKLLKRIAEALEEIAECVSHHGYVDDQLKPRLRVTTEDNPTKT